MATSQELQVQQKRELENKEEAMTPTRVFMPTADIYETNDALTVILEMPGVEKNPMSNSSRGRYSARERPTRPLEI